jgi:RHS repeat-associated protein
MIRVTYGRLISNVARTISYFTLLLIISNDLACAQAVTGTPPLGSFAGGPDTVNLANLNASWTVAVVHKSGRGVPFQFDLNLNTSAWYVVTSGSSKSWQPTGSFGRPTVATPFGYPTVSARQTYCNGDTHIPLTIFSFTYTDPGGTVHPFPISTWGNTSTPCSTTSATGVASDNSGYTLSATGGGVSQVITPDGTVIGTVTLKDRNGNEITMSGGSYTDTLGAVALTVGGSISTPPVTYTYSAPGSGGTGVFAAVSVSYKTYTVKTNFGCSGVSEYGATSNPLVDRITLADGSFYQFGYEATPGFSGDVTGRITTVTVPTSNGVPAITYQYSGGGSGVNGITCADGSPATLTRSTPDGTWIYSRVPGTGILSTTTVTDPQNNQTVHDFSGLYETEAQVFQGSSSLLKTLVICYNNNFTNCTGATVYPPITSRYTYTYYPNLANPGISMTIYNTSGLLTEDREMDYVPDSGGYPYLSDTFITYASLGNILGLPSTVTVKDPGGNIISQTTNLYDQGTPTATSGTPQHVAVTGSRGNLTSTSALVQGATTLTKNFTYYDTGTVNTSQDVNGATATYSYTGSSCGNSFPTGVAKPLGLSQSFAWNCTGGVRVTVTDENSKSVTATYNDPYFWRPNIVTDQLNNQTNISYQPNTTYCCPPAVIKTLVFNNNSSVSSDIQYKDSLGRTYVRQHEQSPGSSYQDSTSYTFDTNGRPTTVSGPCSAGYTGTCSGPTTTQTYDALNRPLVTTDGGGGTVTYSYNANDILVTVGPAPSGENTKRRQLEYDALGRLTSVCEITSATGSGACGQNSSQTGFWTKYSYNVLGKLLTVTQNAQASAGSQQTRSYTYDGMGRLTSETNPESGTTTYSYDASSPCASSSGDLIKKVDAVGTRTCIGYDALHRPTSVSYSNSTNCKFFVYDSNPGVGWTEGNVKGRLSNAYIGNCSNGTPTGADEGYNYSPRGELINVYQTTVASGVWYNSAATYWANGALNTLQLSTCITNCTNTTNNTPVIPLITYSADGEGRPSTVSASSGQNPLTATTYNAASLPTALTYGSADTDALTYDPNTFRMTKYQFNVNGQAYVGAFTWNANGSLGSQVITDPFNSADNQSCAYAQDDLVRLAKADCGAAWQQTFAYDAFGNIVKNVPTGGTGMSFQAQYSTSTNRITSVLGFVPTYDADGNVLTDTNHTYTWDAGGNSITVDGVALTFDATDRIVEQNRSGTLTELVYAPTGQKFAVMNGTTLKKAFVVLPGDATAVYTSAGLDHYRHSDWLGSARLAASPTRTVLSTVAYAPFGETYNPSGTPDLSFTGQNPDTAGGDYDFLYREYSNQGRWASPDPAGLSAASLLDPQTLNRYAYVRNSAVSLTDPQGLSPQNCRDACPWKQTNYSMCSNIGACGSGGFSWSPDANMGYDEFDAIEGAAGTYISYDTYGRANFGFSYDLYVTTKNVIDSIRSGVADSNSSANYHDIIDPGSYPWDGFQVYIHQTSNYTTATGLIPDLVQSVSDVAGISAYAFQMAKANPAQRTQILSRIFSDSAFEALADRQTAALQAVWERVLCPNGDCLQ